MTLRTRPGRVFRNINTRKKTCATQYTYVFSPLLNIHILHASETCDRARQALMFNDPTAPLHHASTTEGVARLQHARAYVPTHASKLNLLLTIKHIHFTLTKTRRRQALLRRPIGTPLPPITRPRHNALRSDTLRTSSKIDGLHMRVFYNVNKGVHIARAQGAAPSMAAKLVTRCASEIRTDRHVPNRPNTSISQHVSRGEI